MNQIDHHYKVKKSEVAFICSYFEAFEGMAAIRTPNPKFGEDAELHFMVSPDFSDQFDALIDGLSGEIMMEKVEP